jgi:hypothetical protein
LKKNRNFTDIYLKEVDWVPKTLKNRWLIILRRGMDAKKDVSRSSWIFHRRRRGVAGVFGKPHPVSAVLFPLPASGSEGNGGFPVARPGPSAGEVGKPFRT